jgi:hypothetical protein
MNSLRRILGVLPFVFKKPSAIEVVRKRGYTAFKCGMSLVGPSRKLDGPVTGHLVDKLFHPERLAAILTSLTARRAAKAESVSNRIMTLQREVTDAEEKLKRLYQLVENGMTDLDDVLKDRLNSLKADRDRAKAALHATRSQIGSDIHIDPALIERFGRSMREKFTSGSIPFRKAYLQSLIEVIEVDDNQVRVKGSKEVLERAVLAGQAVEPGSQMSTRWRASQNKTAK